MSIHIHPLYFLAVAVCWLITYHVAYWAIAIARDPSLICWSVGPTGISVVSLRRPSARQTFAQLLGAALAMAILTYGSLYRLQPGPIDGLGHTNSALLAAVLLPVALVTLARLVSLWYESVYPLWGEARVMARVQRSVASGSRIFFTASGRSFLAERFGATPGEFLRMVRL